MLTNETGFCIDAVSGFDSVMVVPNAGPTTDEHAGVFAALGEAEQETTEGPQEGREAAGKGTEEGGEGAAKIN